MTPASSPQPEATVLEAAAFEIAAPAAAGGENAHERAVPSGGSRTGEMRRAGAGWGSFSVLASTSPAGDESSPVRQAMADEQMDWGEQ